MPSSIELVLPWLFIGLTAIWITRISRKVPELKLGKYFAWAWLVLYSLVLGLVYYSNRIGAGQ